ncbi:MAG: glycosyltransferase [Clostridiales bacterium]
MKKPLIGILLTTYNDDEVINRCLKSLYFQSYENIIIICVDDGSKKDVESFLDFEYSKDKLIIEKIPHSERAVARDTGISILKNKNVDYFIFLDSDMTLPAGFISIVTNVTLENNYIGVVLPELSFSTYKNYWSKVKVLERNIYKVNSNVNSSSSIEAARFWNMELFPDFEKDLKAFEEIQPTLKARKLGYKIGRVNNIFINHDEKYVSLKNLLKKKTGYFNNMSRHKAVNLKSVLTKFYFFRSQLYHPSNIKEYLKHPLLFFGVIFLYIILTIFAFMHFMKGRVSFVIKYSHSLLQRG